MTRQYHVYIMSSPTLTLYTGVTGNLQRRVHEHKTRVGKGFAATYNCTRLVFAEAADEPMRAIEREKQIKSWARKKKIALVETHNPDWIDLSVEWFGMPDGQIGTPVRFPRRSRLPDSSLRSE